MTHTYHDALPGYSPDHILHDGCDECELRAERADHGLSALDADNFTRAWERAAAWQKDGTVRDISFAEADLLRMLWSIQVQLERRGIPIGQVPSPALLRVDEDLDTW